MPDEVRLPSRVYDETLFNATLNVGFDGAPIQKNNSEIETKTLFKEKSFGKNNKKKNNNGNGDGGGNKGGLKSNLNFPVNVSYEVKKLLGEAVNYDKKSRSLVLEFETIQDAINAINILPFGMNYRIYLLDIDS